MKFLFFAFSVLSAFFGMCCCMDGSFNSSEFEALEEEFGLEFFTSAYPSQSDELNYVRQKN